MIKRSVFPEGFRQIFLDNTTIPKYKLRIHLDMRVEL